MFNGGENVLWLVDLFLSPNISSVATAKIYTFTSSDQRMHFQYVQKVILYKKIINVWTCTLYPDLKLVNRNRESEVLRRGLLNIHYSITCLSTNPSAEEDCVI